MIATPANLRVLVTGATGYIGGRLVPRLLEAGHVVTVLVRDRDRIAGLDWQPAAPLAEPTGASTSPAN